MGESVNTKLLGMTKVISDDSARRALRKSPYVKKLILQQHCNPGWEKTHAGWEALATKFQLSTWKEPRRVVLVRRRLQENIVIAPDSDQALPHQLSVLEPSE